MNLVIDLNTLLTTVVGAFVVYGVKGIVAIDRKLSAQNGRLGKVETWLGSHEKLDDERHAAVVSNIHELRETIQNSDRS